jgi:GlpG protein
MRLLATIEGKDKAESIAAYLLVKSISTHVEAGEREGVWDIWTRDEDRVEEAKSEMAQFLDAPDAPRYVDAVGEAQKILREQKLKQQAAAKNIRSGKSIFKSIPGSNIVSGGIPPITLTLIVVATIVSFVTDFMKPQPRNQFGTLMYNELTFVRATDFAATKDPRASLNKGEWWRAVTPIFLHGFTFHLLFNVLALAQLGRIVERIEGSVRFAWMVLVMAVLSNLFQGLMPEKLMGFHLFGGLSGVVYGVFAYLWIKSVLRPDMGIILSQTSVAIMLGWLVLGFTNKVGAIANLAHLGGLVTGVVLALILANVEAPKWRR